MPRTGANGRKPLANFYVSVLDEAELMAALEVEGVDDELAALRVQLKALLRERPEDFELMLKGVQTIVRAAGTRYRISAKSKDDLAEAMAAVVSGVGVQLFPGEDFDV
jgi:hypothetical protein